MISLNWLKFRNILFHRKTFVLDLAKVLEQGLVQDTFGINLSRALEYDNRIYRKAFEIGSVEEIAKGYF